MSENNVEIREVVIPAIQEHAGLPTNRITVKLLWVCSSHTNVKRGEPHKGISWDGSRRLEVDCWENTCGCVDTYKLMREEARRNGLNKDLFGE